MKGTVANNLDLKLRIDIDITLPESYEVSVLRGDKTLVTGRHNQVSAAFDLALAAGIASTDIDVMLACIVLTKFRQSLDPVGVGS